MQTYQLLGRDNPKTNRIHLLNPNPQVGLATTAGNADSVKKKTDPNEDCVAWYKSAKLELAILADAHFGDYSSHRAMEKFPLFWNQVSGNIEKRLFNFHLYLDQLLNQEPGNSATTLVTIAIQDQRLIWVSSGDSPLWLWRDQKLEPINILHHGMYLGPPENIQVKVTEELLGKAAKTVENDQLIGFLLALTHFSFFVTHKALSQDKAETLFDMMSQQLGAPLPFSLDELLKPWHPAHLLCAHQLPMWGSLNLMQGDRILLASDGLEEGVSGITKKQLTEILGLEKSMPEIAKELLKQVLRKGGFDNCTLWLRGI